MSFRLFEFLDSALVEIEARDPFASREPRVWPSEASVDLLEPGSSKVGGRCHRVSYFRLVGEAIPNQIDAKGARRVRAGKAVEKDVALMARESGLLVASGLRYRAPSVNMGFELDLVVLDPTTKQAVICENKSFYGYEASKQILKQGKPKLEHLMQILIYLNEIRTGEVMKQACLDGLDEQQSSPTKWNRIEVIQSNLELMDPGPVAGKLLYESRDTMDTREFDIAIYEDYDGWHYPSVDGVAWKSFTLESV